MDDGGRAPPSTTTPMTLPKSTCQGLRTFYKSSLRHAFLVPLCFGTRRGLGGYIYRQDIAVIDGCTASTKLLEPNKAQQAAQVACLQLSSSNNINMASARRWSRLLAISAFVCLLVVHPSAMVSGLRREDMVLGSDRAPTPAQAPAAGGGGASSTTGKQSATATAVGAAQMSKWRVRRGSDPIHNRS